MRQPSVLQLFVVAFQTRHSSTCGVRGCDVAICRRKGWLVRPTDSASRVPAVTSERVATCDRSSSASSADCARATGDAAGAYRTYSTSTASVPPLATYLATASVASCSPKKPGSTTAASGADEVECRAVYMESVWPVTMAPCCSGTWSTTAAVARVAKDADVLSTMETTSASVATRRSASAPLSLLSWWARNADGTMPGAEDWRRASAATAAYVAAAAELTTSGVDDPVCRAMASSSSANVSVDSMAVALAVGDVSDSEARGG
mmetsp:Transcript_19708/g.42601  ORF Transcript_19708/g.42601 Transcript_19708/m.42601 type:complete len:263 (-) Transcript_19708:189-977(-)